MRRLPLTLLSAALISGLAACDRARSTDTVAGPPNGGATAYDANPQVLGPDGHCDTVFQVRYLGFEIDGERFEPPMREAMSDVRAAQAAKASDQELIEVAHRARKTYGKLMKLWYTPFMEYANGPFRCVTPGRRGEVLSSDLLFANVPTYTAFIESIAYIPVKPKEVPLFSRLWSNAKEMSKF